jgi:hypothetical protein
VNDIPDELMHLLDEAVKHLETTRCTFTEREALAAVWQAGYDFPIQSDPRFALAYNPIGKRHRHWRLASQTVANNRMLNELLAGTWDGRNLDRKLDELDVEDQQYYVFCPIDPRFEEHNGIWEPAKRERTIALPPALKATLDGFGEVFLARWRAEGAEPWTIRQITETLGQLGWKETKQPNSWLFVRAWLLLWEQVVRVGLDYWLPADLVQQAVEQTRLQVIPLRGGNKEPLTGPGVLSAGASVDSSSSTKKSSTPGIREGEVLSAGDATTPRYTWTVCLRTINLMKGFLHVPAAARGAYTPPAPGVSERVILRAMWFEDGTLFWLWLDRGKDQLYGVDLQHKLEWLSAGTLLRIEWAPDIIVIRQVGHDEEVEREEARLADLEALDELRGGLGESYRQSLQALLAAAPEGMTLTEVVAALRARQGHYVHRGTIQALLYNGGFVQKDQHWFAATDPGEGARQLRAAVLETLVPDENREAAESLPREEYIRVRVQAIRSRLAEIIHMLRRA